jgi:hypothetical protein
LVLNRMCPSAYLLDRGHTIGYSLVFQARLRRRGVRVIDGYDALQVAISNAAQLSLLESRGLP